MSYPYPSIWINGTDILLADIAVNKVVPRTSFEEHTFFFIREWLNGREEFEISTSGSTGTPKRISLTRDQMTASATLTITALQLKEGDHALICLDTHYIAGQMMVVRSFVAGMKMFCIDPSSNPLRHLPRELAIDFAAFVPLQLYEMIRSEEKVRLQQLKKIIAGGASLDKGTIDALQTFSNEVYATYGMTETISHIALQRLNGPLRSDHFFTLPGINIHLDERGCLVIRAPHLSGPVITNDLVELLDERHFIWLGRYDNVINSGGIKVIPEVLEASVQKIFNELNIHRRFMIAGLPDIRLGNRIILVIEGEKLEDLWMNILTSSFPQVLSRHEMPREVFFISSFLQTENGKIDRKATILNGLPAA